MASNAWERAQDAIAHASQRATERHEDVITPDTAVSPFDASSTTVLPHGLASRAAGSDPDLTQRIPHSNGHHHADGHQNGHGIGQGRPTVGPNAAEDARTVRFRARTGNPHPGTSPFPASPFPEPAAQGDHDRSDGAPDDRRDGRHGTRRGDRDETPALDTRRSWWRRLFGG